MGKYEEASLKLEKCNFLREKVYGKNSFKISELLCMKGIILKEKN